ncbi:hypothetical protein F4677DRAFT_409312 [Hypoxylon crocopeplum]|nr:hypothetical protein F4677DRAFT_409312 [Hypoxylon crocopeplum]
MARMTELGDLPKAAIFQEVRADGSPGWAWSESPRTPPRARAMQQTDRINYSDYGAIQHNPANPFRNGFELLSPPLYPSRARVTDSQGLTFVDPGFDVLNSPSLPKDFRLPTALKLKNTFNSSPPLRDPFVDSDDEDNDELLNSPYDSEDLDDSDDSDDSEYSYDSDATITIATFSASLKKKRGRASPEERSPTVKRSKHIDDKLYVAVSAHLPPSPPDSDPGLVGGSSDEEASTSYITKEMAPNHAAKNGTVESRVGPPLGTIKVGHQYICESHIRRMFAEKRLDVAREANYRLQGTQLIESIREALLLPVKTYNAACSFYHLFRLEHPSPDYNYTEAALASLFTACKVEDTLKKSREILCAHHNLKNPDHPTTQDDKIFDQPYKVIIGLERYVVEAISFDFRVRYPQKILVKIVKKVIGNSADASNFFTIALKMSMDMYKTYAPLKHGSFTCAFVLAQLTALITGQFVDEFRALDPLDWHTDEQCVAEVMLDLLDLYTQHGKATKIGPMFDQQRFIDTQIMVNQYVERAGLSRYLDQCRECESALLPPTPATDSPISFSTPSASGTGTVKRGPKGSDGGTTRFVFDADEAAQEKQAYDDHVKDEWEEHVEEVEEPIPDPRDDRRQEPRGPRGPRGHHVHGHGHGRGRGGFDPGWNPRNRHDRRRRGGGGFY